MASCMLLLSKYLDYRIKVGDCSLEWNPLIIPASAAEQTAVANIDEDAMQVVPMVEAIPFGL
jgi:hypothetical protein